MKFVAIFCLYVAIICLEHQIVADMTFNQYCSLWEKANKQQQLYELMTDDVNRKMENLTTTLMNRMENQSDAINNRLDILMNKINNVITQNNNSNTNEKPKYAVELEKLQDENERLNNDIIKLNESSTDERLRYEEKLQNLQDENKLLKDENMKLNESITDERLRYEEKLQNLQDENKLLKDENMKLNESITGCSPSNPELCIQTSASGRWTSGGHRINTSFDNVFSRVVQANNKFDMYEFNNFPNRMTIVRNHLWVSVSSEHTVYILDTDTVGTMKTLTSNEIRHPWSLSDDYHGHVLLCSSTGLHLLNQFGSYLYTLAKGVITDIHIECNVAYLYNLTNNNVVTLTYYNSKWAVNNTFLARSSFASTYNTIFVIQNKIYLSSLYKNVVQVYTLTGVYSKQYGSRFQAPFLSGVDSGGSLLICDENNNRFQVLKSDGTWDVYKISGIIDPYDIVIDTRGWIWVVYNNNGYKISRISV